MKLLSSLGIYIFRHHDSLHIAVSWFPIHLTISTDGTGWNLLDAQHQPVRMHFAFYRLIRQSVLVIGSFAFRLDRTP